MNDQESNGMTEPQTFNELMCNIRKVFPECEVCEDPGGQIIIYTGKQEEKDGQLIDHEPE